jgi:beta-lactamase regulating signal transducer with metallopeptidase domain
VYWFLFTGLSLAVFFLAHSAFGGAAALAARWLEPRMHRAEAHYGKRLLIGLRLFPFLAASALAMFLAAPAFLLYEPVAAEETLPPGIALMAGSALVLLLHAFTRTTHTAMVTRRAVRRWERGASRSNVAEGGLPIFTFPSDQPVMAVVGLWRARLFVSSRIHSLLTEEEFRAAVQHERAHHRARDLWHQWLLRALPDLCPGLGALRRLERMIAQKVEEAADVNGVSHDRGQALALASALLKVARTASSDAGPLPVGAYLLPQGGESALAQRVLRLTRAAASPAPAARRAFSWVSAAVFLALAAGGLAHYGALLRQTHELLEALVR